jgi:hypothetical protein
MKVDTTTITITKIDVMLSSMNDKDNNTNNNNSMFLLNESTTAVLYQSVDVQQGCGHAIPWIQWQDMILPCNPTNNHNNNNNDDTHHHLHHHNNLHCPICHCSVGMVVDGRVVAAAAAAGVENVEDAADEKRDYNSNNDVVYFKYGKQTYQLSTALSSQQEQQQQSQPPTNSAASDIRNITSYSDVTQRKSFLLKSLFTSKQNDTPTNDVNDNDGNVTSGTELSGTMLAQDRIVQALQFVDRSKLKIIYQGKVLYPSSSSSSTTTKTTKLPPPPPSTVATTTNSMSSLEDEREEWNISKTLLEISQHDLSLEVANNNNNNNSNHRRRYSLKKPSLVVMGTRLADLQSLQRQEQKLDTTHNNNNKNHNNAHWWNYPILRLPIFVVTVVLQVSWLMVGTFVAPLLPRWWTDHWRRIANNNINNNNNNLHHEHSE